MDAVVAVNVVVVVVVDVLAFLVSPQVDDDDVVDVDHDDQTHYVTSATIIVRPTSFFFLS